MKGLTPGTVLAAASRHRGLLAGGLAAAAVATGLGVAAPAPPDTLPVLTVSRDLPGGTVLTRDDLRRIDLARQAAADGVLTQSALVEGRVLAGPVRRGEVLTDARLVGVGLLRGQPSDVRAVTLRLADPAAAAMLRAGDQVDILAAAAEGVASGRPAQVIASDVAVLAVPTVTGDSGEGALLVVAALPDTAARLAGAAAALRLSAVVRGEPPA